MKRRSEHSLLLFSALIVFSCLLVSGLPRLIGHEAAKDAIPIPVSSRVPPVLCSAAEAHTQSCAADRAEHDETVRFGGICSVIRNPQISVCSDANGNVLVSGTYLHAVYQSFALGDGFV